MAMAEAQVRAVKRSRRLVPRQAMAEARRWRSLRLARDRLRSRREDAIGATINIKWLKVAATGQWAAAVVIGAALLYIADSIAQHAVFAVFLALFGGFLAGRAASNGRVLDAIRDRERAYLEVDRMAEAKKLLENELLKARISSKLEATKRKAVEATKQKKKGKGDGK
jgi:hypothetical protein